MRALLRLRYPLLVLLLGAAAGSLLPSDAGDDVALTSKADAVDRLFAEWDRKDSPGCVALVRLDGKTVHQKAYGMANLELGIPLSLSSVFLLASVSKQFAVFLIMLLAQQGKLSLDDDVRKYVPELPQFDKTITIRHLIHHTSGLREDLTMFNLAGWRGDDSITREDFMRLVKNQKNVNFQPGDQYLYCNTGYHLLAIIVERVSKKPFSQFAREQIFEPLGMKHTTVREDHRQLIPHLAVSYAKNKDAFALRRLGHGPPGASNVHSTAGDLALWDQNFYDAKVGGRKLLDDMLQKGKLTSGKDIAYAGGLVHGTQRGLKTVSHTGSHGGFKTILMRFPDQRFSVILLSNMSDFPRVPMAHKVADIYLAHKLTPRPREPAEVILAPEKLEAFVGDYKTGFNVWEVRKQTGRLVVNQSGEIRPLTPIGESEFIALLDYQRVRFEKKNDIMILEADDAGKKTTAKRLQFIKLPAEKLAGLAGTYYSEELGVLYRVDTSAGKAVLRQPKGEAELHAVSETEFLAKPGSAFFSLLTLKTAANAEQQVTGLIISTDRVRNLKFAKVRVEPAH
ncbi:MAG: beta-lactamase family protein [Gemmataceae bacterium]|nr:beta-lactamase family protein [Gemmataceae bacterium]MCI0742824.1 beta-lactamase family protein [Gemmataceae bacterium]